MAGLLLAAAVSCAADGSLASLGLAWVPDEELCRRITDVFFPAVPPDVRTERAPANVWLRATGRKS